MRGFRDATQLLKHAEAELPTIREAYERSLAEKKVRASLQVEIKNFLENIRSALDFAARGLYDKYGSSRKSKQRIYFPYATTNQDRATFEESGRIDVCIPGLQESRPDLVQWLLEIQHFGSRPCSWLPDFMDLANENKHERLTPQVRNELKELRVTGGGASIGMGEGSSISVAPGASISIGGAIIGGAQTFGVGRPPRVQGGKVETITWISFEFESNGRPVLPFLEEILNGASYIVRELSMK